MSGEPTAAGPTGDGARSRGTRPAERRYVVAKVDDVPEGGRLFAEVGGIPVGIFRLGGEFHALMNRCPHAGGPLCEGQVLWGLASEGPGDVRLDTGRKFVTCPWHGWEFDLVSGQSYCDPRKMRVRPYPVDVEGGEAVAAALDGAGDGERVEGPFSATVLPISVEDDYLVITIGRRRPAGGA